MTDSGDRALVSAVTRRGDPRAFGELYERHTPAMYGLALRLAAGAAPDAEDIVHDAWVRAVERLDAFEWRSTLRTWLCGFVVLRWREECRRREREPAATYDHAGPVSATPDDRLNAAVDRIDLERAVRRLPDGYREVLVLHDIQQLPHEEIAGLLGIAASTSRSQLARARRALKLSLQEPGGAS